MRKRNNRGQMRVIEVIAATFIVISALGFITTFAATPASQRQEASDLEKMGYSALLDLDHHGLLAPLVYASNPSSDSWSGDLRTLLKITLPVDVYFNLTVYHADWTRVSDKKIVYGEEAAFSSSSDVASVSYILSGYRNGYEPRVLLLQLTRG